MNLTFLKFFLSRNDIKVLVIATLTGGILQVLAKQYLKNHPEFLMDAPVTQKKDRRSVRFLSPRGGDIQISAITIQISKIVVNYIAKKGFLTSLVATSGAIVIRKIPATAISTYLRDAFPQNLPHLEKTKFILIDGDTIYLDQCDENLEHLFTVLEDVNIPFEERKEIAMSALTKYLNIKTPAGRRNFVLCIIFIIYICFNTHRSSYVIMMKALIKAVREGRIGKPMARLIIRKLRRKGVPIDPELAELVAS